MKGENEKSIDLLTIEEAANVLRLKKSRLRQAVFRREVKYVKLGALIRFKREHLVEWIEKSTMGPAA